MSYKAKNQVIDVLIDDLKAHPRQGEIFSDLGDAQLEDLAKSLKTEGQNTPIEITPDRVTICGHQRLKAARSLGWKKIKAKVRQDLADEGEASIFDRLVQDNVNRRQLDKLGQARCYKALKENAKKSPRSKEEGQAQGDLRDRLATQFKVEGRTLDRWLKVLETPIEVQEAVSAKKLTMDAAGRVAGATKEIKKKVVARLKAGENPKSVVAELLPVKKKIQEDNYDVVQRLLRHLRKDVKDLMANTEYKKALIPENVAFLRQAISAIEALIENSPKRESVMPAELKRKLVIDNVATREAA
jgi:ParB/RepB/Spo0J family partition protein